MEGLIKWQWILRALLNLVLICTTTGCGHTSGSSTATAKKWNKSLKVLQNSDLATRRKAAQSLVEAAYEISVRLPSLVDEESLRRQVTALAYRVSDREEDPQIRRALARVIGFCAKYARDAQHRLIEVLKDENDDEQVRCWIAMILPDIDPSENTTFAILTACQSQNSNVRVNASQQLYRLEVDADTFFNWASVAIKDKTPQVRIGVIVSAAKFLQDSTVERVLAIVLRGVNDSHTMVRNTALMLLAKVSTQLGGGSGAKEVLVGLLRSSEDSTRLRAAGVLLSTEETFARQATDILIEGLRAKDAGVRAVAAQALGDCGAKAKIAAPQLIERLRDADQMVRVEAAFSVLRIGGDPKQPLTVLVNSLGADNTAPYMLAAGYLALTMKSSRQIIEPLLRQKLKHRSSRVRGIVITLLSRLGLEKEEALKLYTSVLQDDDPDVRVMALQSLASMKQSAKPALSQISVLFEDENLQVQLEAKRTARLVNGSTPGP